MVTTHTDADGTSRGGRGGGAAVRAARAVTEVFTPAAQLVGLLAAVGAASRPDRLRGLGWGLLAALFTAVLPYLVVLIGVRRGSLGNHHLTDRKERLKPFGVALVLLLAGLALLIVAGAPRQVVALVVAMLTGLVVTTAITLAWKISVHASVAAGTATILTAVFGWWMIITWPVVAAIGWSRVVLREHTVAQVLGGIPMGIATSGLVFVLLRGSPT